MSKNPNVIPCSYRNCRRSESTHLALDGYSISDDKLDNYAQLSDVLDTVNRTRFGGEGHIGLVTIGEDRSFNPLDQGLLGYVVGREGYFACRTSLYYKTLFADLYTVADHEPEGVAGHLMKAYSPRRTSRCRDQSPSGKYGRHVVFRRSLPMEFFDACDLAGRIVHKLQLCQNAKKVELTYGEGEYSVFIPLIEGYLTIFSSLNGVVLSIFSSHYFEASVPRRMFSASECYSIQRGSNLEIARGPIFTPEQLNHQPLQPTMWQGGTLKNQNRAAILGAPTGGG